MDAKIDFVVTWVDGEDPVWLAEKKRYKQTFKETYKHPLNTIRFDDTSIRYRNNLDFLRYWFRGVEEFAPWVNRIFFITVGHLPKWINLDHPKLKIIRHKDFIPKKYLPTFNSHTIENNLHRIEELSENFVYFNDDFYLLKKTRDTDFFVEQKRQQKQHILPATKLLPRAFFAENILINNPSHDIYPYILINNMAIVNKYFDKRTFFKKHLTKALNLRNSVQNLRTLTLLAWRDFSLIYDPHCAISYQKSSFEEVWRKEYKTLDETCSHKFRTDRDVSHLIFYYFQLLKGDFIPRSANFSHHTMLSQDEKQTQKIVQMIRQQKYHILAINDGEVTNPIKTQYELKKAFSSILPKKSQFEK